MSKYPLTPDEVKQIEDALKKLDRLGSDESELTDKLSEAQRKNSSDVEGLKSSRDRVRQQRDQADQELQKLLRDIWSRKSGQQLPAHVTPIYHRDSAEIEVTPLGRLK